MRFVFQFFQFIDMSDNVPAKTVVTWLLEAVNYVDVMAYGVEAERG